MSLLHLLCLNPSLNSESLLSCQTRMYLLSLEGAKAINLCLVVSMIRSKSFPKQGPALIIIVLIFLKDDRALIMSCKQHHYWLSEKERKKKTYFEISTKTYLQNTQFRSCLYHPCKIVLGSKTILRSLIIQRTLDKIFIFWIETTHLLHFSTKS